jgi:hypothetical protein
LRASRSSRSRRAFAATLVAAACCSAAAAAQTSVAPREGDNYLQPVALSSLTDPHPFPRGELRLIADTTQYTIQQDLYTPPRAGGPREPARCAGASYGNTLWVVFHADRFGTMDVGATGDVDPVVRMVPFDRPRNPVPDLRRDSCRNEGAGRSEQGSWHVERDRWYALQFGGAAAPQGGPLELSFQLRPPPEVAALARLRWKRRPLRVASLLVDGLRSGEVVSLHCTKGACRNRTVRVRKSERMEVLRNRHLRRGAEIELRITAPGHVGRLYRWKARRGKVAMVRRACLDPGSRKPRRKCGG